MRVLNAAARPVIGAEGRSFRRKCFTRLTPAAKGRETGTGETSQPEKRPSISTQSESKRGLICTPLDLSTSRRGGHPAAPNTRAAAYGRCVAAAAAGPAELRRDQCVREFRALRDCLARAAKATPQ